MTGRSVNIYGQYSGHEEGTEAGVKTMNRITWAICHILGNELKFNWQHH